MVNGFDSFLNSFKFKKRFNFGKLHRVFRKCPTILVSGCTELYFALQYIDGLLYFFRQT